MKTAKRVLVLLLCLTIPGFFYGVVWLDLYLTRQFTELAIHFLGAGNFDLAALQITAVFGAVMTGAGVFMALLVLIDP